MTQPADSIYLIYQASQESPPVDRLGAEPHGALGRVTKLAMKEIKIEQISSAMNAQALSLATEFEKKLSDNLGKYTVDEISLSLAVTAEGNIGIATAGVQGSITFVLKRHEE